MRNHFIQHITDSQSGRRRDRNRIPDPKIIELIHVRHKFIKIIHLVDNKHNWFFRTSEHICHFGIRILKSLSDIGNEHNDICRINGDLRLLSHL